MALFRRSVEITIVALVASIGVIATSSPVHAEDRPENYASATTYVDSVGIVHYAFNPATMPGGRIETQVGTRISDPAGDPAGQGCRFTVSGAGTASGARDTYMLEVTYDPGTCTRKLAIASYPTGGAPGSLEADVNSSDTAGSSSAEETPFFGSRPPTGATKKYGMIQVNVEDPVQKDVNRTRSKLWWWSTSSCVTDASYSSYWYWYDPTGWSRLIKGKGHNRACAEARTQTYGKYKNNRFCLTVDTYVEHWQTEFKGRPSGSWAYASQIDKWGGCNQLLHYEYKISTP